MYYEKFRFSVRDGSVGNVMTVGENISGDANANEYHLLSAGYNDSNSTSYMRYDGETAESEGVSGNFDEDANSNNHLVIGGGHLNRWAKGHMKELIYISSDTALSDRQIAEIQAYLAAKWGLQANVDSDNDGFTDAVEIANGSTVTDASSTPSDIPAVIAEAKLWLDASNVDGYNNISLSDGDAVSTWTDLSGNGNDAAPKGSANQPTYKGDKVYFDGSNDYLRIPISANDELDVSNKSFTAFLIYKPISNSNTTVLISNYENSTTPYWGVSFNSQNHFGFNARESSSNSNSNSGGYLTTNQVHLLTASFNEDTGKSIAGFDGNHNVDEDIWTSGSFINISKNPNLIIGSGHLNRFAEGEIMEVLLFNSDTPLTPQQIIDIQSYLSQKWGLNSTVDSDNDGFTVMRWKSHLEPQQPMQVALPQFVGATAANPGSSCKMIADAAGAPLSDGVPQIISWIQLSNGPANAFEVYCHNMTSDFPTEYLELKKVSQGLDTEGYNEGLIDTTSGINTAITNGEKFNYAYNYFTSSEFEFQEYAKLRLYLEPLSGRYYRPYV